MIAAAMIVGPGESLRYLDRTLRLAAEWADEIVVVLDGDDADNEHAVKGRAAWSVLDHGMTPPVTPVFRHDESLVRNVLMAQLDERLQDGDLVVGLDADEELAARNLTVRAALTTMAADKRAGWWPVLFHHLWTPDGAQQRVDGGWAPARQDRVWRHVHGARIPQRELACGQLPATVGLEPGYSPLFVRHWGYARHDDRVAKHARYQAIDGGRYHSGAHLDSILDLTPTLEAAP